jgi:hypothetical protein
MSISSLSNLRTGNILSLMSNSGPNTRTPLNLLQSTLQIQSTTANPLTSDTYVTTSQNLQDPSIEALKMDDVLVSRHLAQGGSPALQLRSPMGLVSIDLTQLFR